MMLFSVLSLSLCIAFCLGDGGQVEEDMTIRPFGVQYTLDFTWPIDNILSLPPGGEHWEYRNEEPFLMEGNNITAPRWLFRLFCSDEKFGDTRQIYLALRLESLPREFAYLYGGAECGILDNNGRLKNQEKTGKNALLPSLNLRFDPFFNRNVLTRNAGSFIKAPNETMTVKCSIKGELKEEVRPFNETINGELVTADYPSRVNVQEETARVKENGDFTIKVVVAIDNFVDWPMVYHTGNLTFNSQKTSGFAYQLRLYNPANGRYPLFFWVESLPEGKSVFKGSSTCGLIGKKKIHGETVILENELPDYFFTFPNALEHDTVHANVKNMPYGIPATEIFCEMKGTITVTPDD